MLIIGHVALSYILSQLVRLFGHNISTMEILTIVTAGCVVDLDVIVMFSRKNRVSHHETVEEALKMSFQTLVKNL